MPPLIIVLHLESFKQWTLKDVQLVSDLFCLCACKNLEIWDSVSWGVFVFSFQIWQQAFRQWGWDVHIRRGEFCGVELRSAGSWWFAEVRGVAGKIKSATAETWNPQDKRRISQDGWSRWHGRQLIWSHAYLRCGVPNMLFTVFTLDCCFQHKAL